MAKFRSIGALAAGAAIKALLMRRPGHTFTLEDIRAALGLPLPGVMAALAQIDGAPWLGRAMIDGGRTVWWAVGKKKSEAA